MAVIVTDNFGDRWLLERDDPGWNAVSGALRQGLPLDYQIVPLEVLLGLPLPDTSARRDMDIDTRCRLWETGEAIRGDPKRGIIEARGG